MPHDDEDHVGLRGLEPLTSSLSGKRSNRLSYRPGGTGAGYRKAGTRPKRDAPRRWYAGGGSVVVLGEDHLEAAEEAGGHVVEERAEGRDHRDQHDVDDGDDHRE